MYRLVESKEQVMFLREVMFAWTNGVLVARRQGGPSDVQFKEIQKMVVK